MRLDDALSQFTLQLRANGRSPLTIAQYRRHVVQLARWRGTSFAIEAITPEDLAAFLVRSDTTSRSSGEPKKATSMNALRSALKAFFGFLYRAGYLARDPSRLIQRARCAPPPPRALSDDERTRLLDVLRNGEGAEAVRDFALFHLLVATGIRLGSALALESNDVDLDQGELTLRTAKGNAPTRIVLGIAIREHLRRYRAGHSEGLLFPITARHAQRRLKHWLSRAGIASEISPHAMRHTFATSLYHRTHDMLLVGEALRHRSVASTAVYARFDSARLQEALAS